MKTQITNYTFDASARTITFGDFATIELESIGEIINATRDAVIYNPLNKKKGGSVSGNVLTLEDNTTIMGDNDDLIVLYFVSDDNPLNVVEAPQVGDLTVAKATISADESSYPNVSEKIDVTGYRTALIYPVIGGTDTPTWDLHAGAINVAGDGFEDVDVRTISDNAPLELNVAGLGSIQFKGDGKTGTNATLAISYKLLN